VKGALSSSELNGLTPSTAKYPTLEELTFWRTFLGVTLLPVMYLCGFGNDVLFGHVSLPSHFWTKPKTKTAGFEKDHFGDFENGDDVESGGAFETDHDPDKSSIRKYTTAFVTILTRIDKWLPFSRSDADVTEEETVQKGTALVLSQIIDDCFPIQD
jgi:hypothetical protein